MVGVALAARLTQQVAQEQQILAVAAVVLVGHLVQTKTAAMAVAES
jgi:hypothetical protein